MASNGRMKFVWFGVVVAAASLALVACDNGTGGGGGSGGSASTTTGATTSGATTSGATTTGTASTSGTSSSGSGTPLSCPTGFCAGVGDGGYAFAYADGEGTAPTGTSMATLAADNTLCISGNTMALPASPTPAQYTADWGCGIGVNLNQAMGTGDGGTPVNAYTLTGTGVTVTVSNIPSCISSSDIRVVLDQNGATPDYCATLTNGVEIPWAMFNTECWMPASGVALTGPPMSQALKVQFVTTMTECQFTSFCIDSIAL